MYVLETNSGLFKELGDVSSLRGLEESTLVDGGSAWLRREWVALGSLADRRRFVGQKQITEVREVIKKKTGKKRSG